MEILYSEPITGVPWWVLVLFAVMFVATFMSFAMYVECGSNVSCVIAIFSLVVTIVLLGAIIVMNEKRETGRTRYEVILDEDYPVSKLYEEYIVKEQRGKIWILEDKEASE